MMLMGYCKLGIGEYGIAHVPPGTSLGGLSAHTHTVLVLCCCCWSNNLFRQSGAAILLPCFALVPLALPAARVRAAPGLVRAFTPLTRGCAPL